MDPLRKSYMYILPTIGNKKNLNHNSTNVNKPWTRHGHTLMQTIDPKLCPLGGKYESK